jgi:lipopolysaccharide heptosyltransferase I
VGEDGEKGRPVGKVRILIVKPSSMGDIVHALPVAAELRRRHPAAHIAWVVKRKWAPLLEEHPDLDEVIPMDFTLFGFWKGVRELRARRFDVAIDVQGLARSGLLAWLSGAKTRIGFERSACREPINALFTNREIRVPPGAHVVDKNMSLFGISGARPALGTPAVSLRAGVGIHPGVGAEVKAWDPERFAALCDRLVEAGVERVILFGGSDSDRRIDDVRGAMKREAERASLMELRELCAFLGRCRVVVSADSGPLHLAAALGTPTVGLFGPSNPDLVAPRGENAVALKKPCTCSGPKGIYFNRDCPERACMKSLEADEVFGIVRSLLEK